MLSPADLRLLAWRGPFPPCTCGQTRHHRCRTASGALTTDGPHKARRDYATGYVAHQPEVDAALADAAGYARLLDAEKAKTAQMETQLAAAEAALADALDRASVLGQELTDARQDLVEEQAARVTERQVCAQLVADLRGDAVRLGATITALLSRLDELEHPPPATAVLLGAGGGNIDRTKDDIDIDRWYGGAGDVDKAVTKAKANHAAGILTWVSFKLPFSWADMASGKGDAWATALLNKLEALGFEVWLAFHHEPEGDGPMADWTKMQAHLSRLNGTGGNVKFSLIVTGYAQEFGTDPAYKWDAIYPAGSPIDIIAYDAPYLNYGFTWVDGVKTATMDNRWTEGATYVDKLAVRAKALGVHAAIGEFGYSDEAFAKDKAWLDRTLAAGRDAGLLAMCYFDTSLNSKRSWLLGAATSPKRAHFYAAVKAVRGS